jgi:NADH-quinone oxidoreductase subunit L
MSTFLHLFILIPLLGFIVSLFAPEKKEKIISTIAFATVGVHFGLFVVFIGYWFTQGTPIFNIKEIVLLKTVHYEFFIDLFFDKITATYLFVGATITFFVTAYSRYYLHKEPGYRRFFNTILFFYLAYNITILSGNLETMFIGWEMLGISSFLLIAFYRNRYWPVKNAIKVFSVYRIGDVGLILAMWASHHLWNENITFLKLSNYELVHEHLTSHSFIGVFISLMILLAAAAKSAQLPFSSWLPRAMEGPTPSSAIFYGSLSVNLGVFIMLRMYPFWEHQISVRVLIGLMGLSTALVATTIARVQSSIKSQIAYSSIAQIGIIFIEVALGLETLALVHFAGNAFLRTYQLLVSPSVVSYLIREQFYTFKPRLETIENSFPQRLEYSIYMLGLKEWNLENLMSNLIWKPFKKTGEKLDFLTLKSLIYLFIPAYLVGLTLLYFQDIISQTTHEYLAVIFAFTGLIMVLKSFSERKSPRMSWLLIILNHLWIVLAISFNEKFGYEEAAFYLSGISVAGVTGYIALSQLKSEEEKFNLNNFYGHVYEHPKLALIFLLSCLGLTGFPITPTFIGIDLVFSHIHSNQVVLACFISLSFIVSGLSAIRLYGRIFLGPHIKTYHEMPFKSS